MLHFNLPFLESEVTYDTEVYRMSQNFLYKLRGKAQDIIRIYNYASKHGRNINRWRCMPALKISLLNFLTVDDDCVRST